MLKHIIFTTFFILPILVLSQNQTLSGRIVDSNSENPLPGAHIMVVGTTAGTATNSEGRFTIANLPARAITIRVSFSGYSTIVTDLVLPLTNELEIKMEPVAYDINQVVVTGTRSPKSLKETPVLTQVISSSTLETADLPTIETALERTVPGIEFSHGAYGPSIQMMGLPGNYVVFLKDGNKIAGETNGNIDYNRLSTQGADRIELVRGASSVLYGSNAMAGVVNVISKPQIEPVKLDLLTRYSNYNTALIDGNLGVKNNNLVSQSSYRFSHTDGYDLNDITTDGKTVERTTSNQFTQKFIWTPLKRLEMEARGSVFVNHMEQSLSARNDKAHSDLDYSLRSKFYFTTKTNVEINWHEDRYKTYEKEEYNRLLQYDNRYKNLRAISNIALTDNNIITTGVEFIREKLVAPRNKIFSEKNTDWVFYVQDDARITKWLSLTGGIRYNYNVDFTNHTTWQLSAMTNFNWLTIRANLATGFKTPTLKELYMDYRIPTGFPITLKGNPDLEPEESKYRSISAEANFKKLNLSVNVYQNNIDKMITEVQLPFNPANPGLHYVYQNVDEVKVYGIDFLANWKPRQDIHLSGGYSYYSALDEGQDRQLIGSRNHTARLNLDYYMNHPLQPKFALQSSYFGEIYRTIIDEESGEETNAWLDGFTLWKTVISIKPIKNITINCGVDNIFDYTDRKTFATFSPGRTFFAGLRLSL